MSRIDFDATFQILTGNSPFPWQRALYERFLAADIPPSCNLPTGLGKTSVIAVWLIALANCPEKIPRRLVYVVNRRTVVDQTTEEVERYRMNLGKAGLLEPLAKLPAVRLAEEDRPLAISTLRGQFADNRAWSGDPARPAVISGTVDMIGSRLLFSGYGVGMKGRPLHAGFLGQDVLLVHDEAHLEPAFQNLLKAIESEQKRSKEFRPFRVMELTATSRSGGGAFPNTAEKEKNDSDPTVQQRLTARKVVHLHELRDGEKVAERVAELALRFKDSGQGVLVFVRTVEDVMKVREKLIREELQVETLTGTMRGKEREELVENKAFKRFLLKPAEAEKTAYLVCTSAGEVGVNLSADHLVCDLSTFESMTQRFGRVNRFGLLDSTEIHVVHPASFGDDDHEQRRCRTLELLWWLLGDGSPKALGELPADARLAAFAPTPTILPVTDILFDAWALTTIRDKLPGRPEVEPYLHGDTDNDFATKFAWREEVSLLTGRVTDSAIAELLEEFPLKPHETLRVPTFGNRGSAAANLQAIAEREPRLPVWVIEPDGKLAVSEKLGSLAREVNEKGRSLVERTVVLPPLAGALSTNGMLNGDTPYDPNRDDYDVAGSPPAKAEPLLRLLVTPADDGVTIGTVARIAGWPVTGDIECKPGERPLQALNNQLTLACGPRVRMIFALDIPGSTDEEDSPPRRYLVVRPVKAASGETPAPEWPALTEHLLGVQQFAEKIASRLNIDKELADAVVLAAKWHDLGKERAVWQRGAGNQSCFVPVAKTLHGRPPENLNHYRHELGSMLDVLTRTDFARSFDTLDGGQQDLVLHLIASHHGRGRPNFPEDEADDPDRGAAVVGSVVAETTGRFARLQRKFGRWGLAYLESLLRAADILESQRIEAAPLPDHWPKGSPPTRPSLRPHTPRSPAAPSITVRVDPTNPGQFFACCGLLELADRLWPQTDDCQAAEGWFADGLFEISCGGTLGELLSRAQQIQFAGSVEEEAEDEDDNEEEKAMVTPLEIVEPVAMRLDWWQDIKLKPWAGSMNVRNIALAMCRAISPDDPDPLNQLQVVREVKEVTNTTRGGKPKPKEPFHFDARRGSNSLGRDVGFIHDTLKKKWKTPMFAHPVVEFFALLGLQRARPQATDKVRVHDYFTWSRAWRCQAALLPLAVCGLLGDPQAGRYRFVNAFRTGKKQHKAYMPASPLPTGDHL